MYSLAHHCAVHFILRRSPHFLVLQSIVACRAIPFCATDVFVMRAAAFVPTCIKRRFCAFRRQNAPPFAFCAFSLPPPFLRIFQTSRNHFFRVYLQVEFYVASLVAFAFLGRSFRVCFTQMHRLVRLHFTHFLVFFLHFVELSALHFVFIISFSLPVLFVEHLYVFLASTHQSI